MIMENYYSLIEQKLNGKTPKELYENLTAMYEALERIANHFEVDDYEALAKEMAEVAREALSKIALDKNT